jgi:hypothetical protein
VIIAALAGLEGLTLQTITGGGLMLLGVVVAITLTTTCDATRQAASASHRQVRSA